MTDPTAEPTMPSSSSRALASERGAGAVVPFEKKVNGHHSASQHQFQYEDRAADFFHHFNECTGRDSMYTGIIDARMSDKPKLWQGNNSIAVDFGCGTGWLTTHLATRFSNVYGIDTSAAMLKIAIADTRRQSADISRRIGYYEQAPEDIQGKCDFISAVHVHYHFEPGKVLKEKFFQVAADLLKPKGEMILIGCPSDHLHNTPDHYQNFVKLEDIPQETLRQARHQVSLLQDEEGYIPLNALPPFKMKDGTQMKAIFRMYDSGGNLRELTLTDTFWSDDCLIKTAQECGLELKRYESVALRSHPHAYMFMHFKKPAP